MEQHPVKDGVQQYDLTSWREFSTLVDELFAKAPAYIYRGQANWDWPIVSSLDRLEARYPRRKNLSGGIPEFFECSPFSEEEHMTAFQNAVRGRRGPNPPRLDDDGWWALGQHHGLATPLVDWTRSPFMALFFAFEEERVREGTSYLEPEQRAVFALSTNVSPGTDASCSDALRFISPLAEDNYRLVSQQALLVRLPRHKDVERCVRGKSSGETRTRVLVKLHVPNDDRDGCLVMLNKMGINHMTLFPDIDGAARHVNSLWRPGHEDLIAYL